MIRLLSIILFLFCNLSFSQNNVSREALLSLKNYQISPTEKLLYRIQDSSKKKLIKWHLDYLKHNKTDTLYSLTPHSTLSKVLLYLYEGDLISNTYTNLDSIPLLKYKKALDISLLEKDSLLICFSTQKILDFLSKNRKASNLTNKYIKIYSKYAYDSTEKIAAKFHKITLESGLSQKEHIIDYKKLLNVPIKNKFITAKINLLIGVQYSYFLKQQDSALYYYEKASKIFRNLPYSFAKNEMFGINTNTGILYANQNQHQKAIYYYKNAISNKLPKNNLLKQSKLATLIYKSYLKLNRIDSALHYFNISKEIEKSFKEYNHAIAINDIEVKYETEKKEKENILLQYEVNTRRRQQRNLWVGAILTLLGTITISLLLYKNTKRKQRIAEQEKQLETNKVEKILKEQELTTIDAMLSGQEKERQRLANDLHDSLGSTLTTIKLYFDHLKRNRTKPEFINDDAFYVKTTTLIDEAYQKVRTIAHEKNSGVMAQQGLLPAIKNLAKKVSSSNQINITVQDYGFNQRLDNTLEISLFRIIQELITNIVKHAQATEATISLTHHHTSLNIIIEDNGVGFNAAKLPQKEGMGLHSIEKRIEHLEGDFEIDSTPEKGTNILIDIPL